MRPQDLMPLPRDHAAAILAGAPASASDDKAERAIDQSAA